MWVYQQMKDEDGEFFDVWTVGFYYPDGGFHEAEEFDTEGEAARRVNYLNGGDGGMF